MIFISYSEFPDSEHGHDEDVDDVQERSTEFCQSEYIKLAHLS